MPPATCPSPIRWITASGKSPRRPASSDSAGNIYFADLLNHRVRKVDTCGNISTIASGLISPRWAPVDSAGNVYICDAGQNEALKLDTSKNLTAYAGNHSAVFDGAGGPATSASLGLPSSIALDSSGNLYILDTGRYRVCLV